MHFLLTSIVTITFVFQFNQASEIRMSSDDMLIKANITHEESKNTWYLAETVYFKPQIHGVIKVQKGGIEMQVFYNLNTSTRIVFLDNDAMEMERIRNFTWNDLQLSPLTIRMINRLLMFGPTYCYSLLKDYNHNEFEDERSLKFRSNNDDQSLFWIYKFTTSITPWVALGELSKITVHSYTDSAVVNMQIVKFTFLNSIKIDAVKQFYVGFNETLINRKYFSKVDTQFEVTQMSSISWMKFKRQTNEYETVNDFRSGLSFTSNHFGCTIESNNQNDQFTFARLTFDEIFLTNWVFQFTYEVLFPIAYEHKDKFITDKMDFNKQIGNFSYDLVVTTLRVTRRVENISSESLLQSLQVERRFYNKRNKSSSDYRLVQKQKHFFSNYIKLNYEPEHQVYTFTNKCFQEAKMNVLTLGMQPSKTLSSDEIYSLFNKLDGLGENLKSLIEYKLGISYLRIKSLRFQFQHSYLVASVEIIERFNFVDSLRKSYRKLDLSGFEDHFASDNETCLKLEAVKSNVSKIISCNGINHKCIGINIDQYLPEENENGSNCVIYNNLDKVLNKLVQEPTLKELKLLYKHLNQTTFFSGKLSFDLFVINWPSDFIPFDEYALCETHCGSCLFLIMLVALIGIIIGFIAILCKSYRRTARVNSTQSISLTILKDS